MVSRSQSRSLLEREPDTETESESEVDITELSNDFFGNRFSAHAIPHVANTSRTHFRRLVWAILSLILLFAVLVLISHLLREYFKYLKQVSIEIEEVEEIVFPSVTVCNFNIVKLSHVRDSKFYSLAELEKRSGRENCDNYEENAPWILDKDYKAFGARDYWAANQLNSGESADFITFDSNITTTTPTTTTTTTTSTTTSTPTTTTTEATTTNLPTECPTKDGTKCSFPFFYFGREYSACIRRDASRAWCATEVDEGNNYIGKWSYCSENCPVVARERRTGGLYRAAMESNEESVKLKYFEDLPFTNYKGYKPEYDTRTQSIKWCHSVKKTDCLQTYGLENLDPYDFETLLQASRREDLSDLRAAFTPDPIDIDEYGQKAQEFITSCTFNKANCSHRDFYVWQSDTYGNCFTFNSPNLYVLDGDRGFKKDNYVRNTTKSGYQNGLRLTLNLDALNYVSLLSPDLGVRVVVHPPMQTPIPEEEGFSISPGFLTSIGIRIKKIFRLGPPHGICQERKWEQYPREYSQTSCRMLCNEQLIQKECHCSNSINDLLLALQTELPRCNPTNLTQDLCRQLVIKKTSEEKLCNCPPACEDILYIPLISTNLVNKNFFNIVKNYKNLYVGDDVCSNAENSTARLHVYLESLQQESMREVPAKTFVSLVADIGGHLGLFIGISIATILELLEFILDAFLIGGKCNCRRKPVKRPPSRADIAKSPISHIATNEEYEQEDQNEEEEREASPYSVEEEERYH